MRRVIEVTGRNLVIRTYRYQRKSQQFYFDQRSKTIKSVARKGDSLDIASAGRSSNL